VRTSDESDEPPLSAKYPHWTKPPHPDCRCILWTALKVRALFARGLEFKSWTIQNLT